MSTTKSNELQKLWAKNFNEDNLDGLMSLFDKNAVFVPQPGQTVTGHAAIREALSGWLAAKLKCDLTFQKALEFNNTALLFAKWTLSGTGPDGSPITMSGQTSDVAQRQADGNWLFVIDNPHGGKAAE